MKRIKEFVLLFLSALFLTTLASCGGGGSDSGGGGGTDTEFAGTYIGNETLSAPGVAPTTSPITIVIASVTITDANGFQYTGELTGNTFTASAVVTVPPGFGISCQPTTVTYTGSISGDTITGSSTGNFACTGPGGSANFTVGGTFTATRNNQARAPLKTSAKQRVIVEVIGLRL